MLVRAASAPALLVTFVLASSRTPGLASPLDSFQMPVDPGAFSEQFEAILNDPSLAISDAVEAVSVLETRLRDYADLASVVELAPQLLDILALNGTLHGLYATALAASGQVIASAQVMDAFTGAPDDIWFMLAQSFQARAQGNFDLARSQVAAALLADPENGYAYNVAGSIDAAEGNWSGAAANFTTAVEVAPEAATYQVNLGAAYLQLGEPGVALGILTEARALGPLTCPLARMQSVALLQTGDPRTAATAIEACLPLDDLDAPTVQQYLTALITANDLATAGAAVDQFGTLLDRPEIWASEVALRSGDANLLRESVSDSEIARTLLGVERLVHAALLDGDVSAAADLIAQTVRAGEVPQALRVPAFAVQASGNATAEDWSLAASSPVEHLFLAMAPPMSGDALSAADHLRLSDGAIAGFSPDGLSAEDLQLSDGESALPAGLALLLRGATGASYEKLAEPAASGRPLAQYLAAVAARQSGQFDAAVGHASEAVSAAPAFRSAFLERAEAALAQGNTSDALSDLATALELRPVPAVALRLGVIAEATGELDTARSAYEALVDLAPDSFIANNQLAWFLVSQDGDTDRALDLAERANTLQPGNASVLDTIGWIHVLRGEPARGREYLQDAFEISRGAIPVIRYHLAAAALETGDADVARTLLDGFGAEGVPEDLSADVEALSDRLSSGN